MREWLSGGAPPCQGGGRGFDPRLALLKTLDFSRVFLFHVAFHVALSYFLLYISSVNSKLKSVDYDITFPSGVTTDFVYCKKNGNIVDFGFRILSGSIPYGSPLATLPADLQPKYNILIPSQYLLINDVASTGNVSLMYNGSIFQEYSATGTLKGCVIKGTFII